MIGMVGFDTTSIAPGRAPIVLARSIADGPARWVLETDCASDTPRYALCEYWGTDIPSNVGEALWDDGGMNPRLPSCTRASAQKRLPLLLEAAAQIPGAAGGGLFVEHLRSGAGSSGRAMRVPRNSPSARWATRPTGRNDTRSRRSVPALRTLHEVGYALGVAGLAWIALRSRESTMRRVCVVVLVGLVLNAAIFGGLSAPVPRYQARVAWLALAVFALLLAQLLARGRAGSQAGG
jgi:hypothetical protein